MARYGQVVSSPVVPLRGRLADGELRTYRTKGLHGTRVHVNNPSDRTGPSAAPRCSLPTTREASMEGESESWMRHPERGRRSPAPIEATTEMT
jgi:hypothetical protein